MRNFFKIFKVAVGNSAFTLVEILLVISIFLIVIAMAVPAFSVFQKTSDLDSDSQEVINTLRLAQSKTVASEDAEQYGVYFDTSTQPNQYVLFKGSSYSARDTSSDEIHKLSNGVSFENLDLWDSPEVIFERISGFASSSSSFGKISLISQENSTTSIYIQNSGLIGLSPPLAVSDAGRITDSRHIHFYYSRDISTSTESIILTFSGGVTKTIPIADNLRYGQFYWQGEVSVGGDDQLLEIQTLQLDSPDTLFCIHRDRRYNDQPLSVSISGDNSGTLIDYTAAGQETRGTSVYLTLGSAGDPQRQ